MFLYSCFGSLLKFSWKLPGVEYGGKTNSYRGEAPTTVEGIRGTVATENDDRSSKVTTQILLVT